MTAAGKRLPRTVVHVTPEDLLEALALGLLARGRQARAAVSLSAHVQRETALQLEAYALAYAKDFPHDDYDGDYVSRYATEWLPPAEAREALRLSGERTGAGGQRGGSDTGPTALDTGKRDEHGRWLVQLWPPHPWARFRAAATLAGGVEIYLDKLESRPQYRRALAAADLGDSDGYLAGIAGVWFTEPVESYEPGYHSAVWRMAPIYQRLAASGALGGIAWTQTLPAGPGPERDAAVLRAVRAGNCLLDLVPLDLTDPCDVSSVSSRTCSQGTDGCTREHRTLAAEVTVDTLRIGVEGDAVRWPCSARLAQWVADELDLVLLPAPMAKIIHERADVRIRPITRGWWRDGSMALTHRYVEQSAAVDAAVAEAGGAPGRLTTGQGKGWWLTAQLWAHPKAHDGSPAAANHGWSPRPQDPPLPIDTWAPIQPVAVGPGIHRGTRWPHGIGHEDYSEAQRWARREARLTPDCQVVDMRDVYTGDLCGLVGLASPLPDGRHPGVGPAPSAAPGSGATTAEPGAALPTRTDPASLPPTVRKGSVGRVVAVAQGRLVAHGHDVATDGDFGPATKAAVVAFQRTAGLTPDGVVGPATWRALLAEPAGPPSGPSAPPNGRPGPSSADSPEMAAAVVWLAGLPYRAARLSWPRPASAPTPSQIMIHTAEVAPRPGAARQLAIDASVSDRASWHYSTDGGGAVYCSVRPERAAGAARGARHAIHVELGTRTAARRGGRWVLAEPDWSDAYHTELLRVTRRLVHALGLVYGIPLRRLTLDQVLAGDRGVLGHGDHTEACHEAQRRDMRHAPWWSATHWQSRAGWAGGTHTDPQRSFPWARILEA